MSIRKTGVIVVAAAAVAAAVWVARSYFSGGRATDDVKPETTSTVAKKPAARSKDKSERPIEQKKPGKTRNRRRAVPIEDEYAHLPERERRAAQEMQNALDAEDFKATCATAAKALRSDDAGLRRDAVDALGWFGEQALPELTPLMGDRDEDVAKAAMDAWQLALSEIQSAKKRIDTAVLALSTITDHDALTMIGAEFTSAALEYIDGTSNEEKAMNRRVEVVQNLVDMIESDKLKNAESAAVIYEDLTGHKWISIEEAEKYISAPDDYEPPNTVSESGDQNDPLQEQQGDNADND